MAENVFCVKKNRTFEIFIVILKAFDIFSHASSMITSWRGRSPLDVSSGHEIDSRIYTRCRTWKTHRCKRFNNDPFRNVAFIELQRWGEATSFDLVWWPDLVWPKTSGGPVKNSREGVKMKGWEIDTPSASLHCNVFRLSWKKPHRWPPVQWGEG